MEDLLSRRSDELVRSFNSTMVFPKTVTELMDPALKVLVSGWLRTLRLTIKIFVVNPRQWITVTGHVEYIANDWKSFWARR